MPFPPPTRRAQAALWMALLLTLLLPRLSWGQSGGRELPGVPPPKPLLDWEYRWDPPLPHAPGEPFRWKDDATHHWQPITPGLRMPDRGDRNRAWFRVRLPEIPWPDAALYFGGVDTSFDAYLDGTLFYVSPRAHGRGPPGWPWYLIRLPRHASGKTLYLDVHSTNPLTVGPYGPLRVGSRSDLLVDTVAEDLQFSLLGLVSMAIGLVALLVFAFERNQRLYLWFALFAMAQGAVYASVSRGAQLVWASPVGWVGVLWSARAIFPASLLAFFSEALGDPRHKRILRWAALAVAVALAVVASGWLAYAWTRALVYWTLNVEFVVCLTGLFALAVRYVRRTGKGKLLCAGGVLLFLCTFLPNVLRSAGLALVPELGHWAYLVLLLGMGIVLLRQFANVHRALKRHAGVLEDKNRRLEEVEATLKEAVRGRDAFLSIASHELRTPLAIITNNTHLLLRGVGAENDKVEAIQRQARHLARMVEDLLDVSRIAHGKLILKPEPLSLPSLVEESLASLEQAARAAGLALIWSAPNEPVWVKADPTRMDQVVGNLVRNALKFTPAGGHVWIELSAEGEEAVLTIRDDGAGIAPEVLPRVFELFVQGDSSRDHPGTGLGVGLALVRQLIEMHGGRVHAQSAGAGQGSTFEVRLPRCAAGVEAPRRTAAVAAQPSTLRVLLVEDNHNLRLSMRLALAPNGFELLEAADGEAGLRRILEERVDVAVVDISMPKMDGHALAKRVRASEASARVKLIALTGYGQPQDRARAEASGFDRLLVKPVDPDELAKAIRELERESRAAQVA